MPNLDALAESYYADSDPQFADDERIIRAEIFENIMDAFEETESALDWVSDLARHVRSIGEDPKRLNQAVNMISDALGLLEEEREIYEEFSRDH